MSKKLMLLVAGALTVLAFSALPSAAMAGEFVGTCSGAACTGTVAGGIATLEGSSGASVVCNSTTGTAAQTNNSSTGTVQLLFHECKDESLNTACTSSGQPSGTIATGSLVYHLVWLEADHSKVGLLLTGINVTFSCASGLVKKTVTGNIIGEIENLQCGVAKNTTAITFEAGATTGTQKWTKVTTAGTAFDLTTNNDAGGVYETASQTGTGIITWGGNVTLDC